MVLLFLLFTQRIVDYTYDVKIILLNNGNMLFLK